MDNITPVFISYDKQDRYFVSLLRALLDDGHIASSHEHIPGGRHSARSLVVVVSEHAVESASVRAELSAFNVPGTDAEVIPVLLDRSLPEQVDPSLQAYQAIDMRADMLLGFTALFARFGRKFLPRAHHHQPRPHGERRAVPDRRKHILRRLRQGLWQHYSHSTGLGKFDEIDVNLRTSTKIISTLCNEVAKYELYDHDNQPIDAKAALNQALRSIEPGLGTSRAIYVIESLASYLYENYEVRNRDRRNKLERRSAKL